MASAEPEPNVAQRNKLLARRLKSSAPDADAYASVQIGAAELLAGRLEPPRFHDLFVSLYGDTESSLELFLELADLVPDQALRERLVSAAGFGAEGSEDQRYQEPSTAKSPEHRGGGRPASPDPTRAAARNQIKDAVADEAETATAGAAVGTSSTDALPAARIQEATLHTELSTGADDAAVGESLKSSAPTEKSEEAALRDLGIHVEATGGTDGARPPKRKRRSSRAKDNEAAPAAASGSRNRSMPNAVYWIRQDLRLEDNPALWHGVDSVAKGGGRLFCVYVHAPEEDGDDVWTGASWRPAGASLLWMQEALNSFDHDLQQRYGRGARIIYQRGPSADALVRLCEQLQASSVFVSKRHEPSMIASDDATFDALRGAGIQVHSYNALLLTDPSEITIDMSKWRGHFGTLTPFYFACERAIGVDFQAQRALAPPETMLGAQKPVPLSSGDEVTLADLKLYEPPTRRDGAIVDWGAPIREAWDISESAANRLLDGFISDGLALYEAKRGLADGRAVSRLSPYLHFGMLSPRAMMAKLQEANCKRLSKTFWRRLVWRDLAYWQLHHWPTMPARSIRPVYDEQQWDFDAAKLAAWQRGRTGFPLVDAGMRQLWQTGWLQQNVRMIVACFLTEYLNFDWKHGARWFHDTLVDADLAINSMMWQNAGKSGLDQWNFTVTPESKSADPTGDYIRKWVPELASLPSAHIRTPWKAPAAVLAKHGVELGSDYPHRIVTEDWATLRARNHAAIQRARARSDDWRDAHGYDIIRVPLSAASGITNSRIRVFTIPDLRKAV